MYSKLYVYGMLEMLIGELDLLLELGNVSCRVGFVFGLNLNGLENPKPEPPI